MGGTIVDIRWRGRELQHTPEINKTAAHPNAIGWLTVLADVVIMSYIDINKP